MDIPETRIPFPHETEMRPSFYAAICDLNGIFRGKRLPWEKLDAIFSQGSRMPMSSIGVDIWGTDVVGTGLTLEKGDLDGVCHSTGRALVDLAWPGGGQPLLPLWMSKEDGSPYFADGRRLLAAVADRFAALGLCPVVATEIEFYLLAPDETRLAPAGETPRGPSRQFDAIYSIEELSSVSGFLDEIYSYARSCAIGLEAATAEGAPRQFEFNLLHQPDALKAADDTVFCKQIIRNVARRHGYRASFMAKPFPEFAGSGLHVHFSILDANGVNIFDDGSGRGSDRLHHAVGGLLDSMAELTLLFAPHLNSYRRLCPGGLAPTTVAWGYENRTSALRIPAGRPAARRIEHRVAGADANPYIVLAGILSGALYGLERALSPPPPVTSNSHDRALPRLAGDWRRALEEFRVAKTAQNLLHPEFVEAFAACKQQEQDVFAARITDFERQTYAWSV